MPRRCSPAVLWTVRVGPPKKKRRAGEGTTVPNPFEEAFAAGPPRRAVEDRGSPLSAEEREFVVYRWYRGDRHAKIARAIGVARSTISAHRAQVRDCPSTLTELRLFVTARVAPPKGGKTTAGYRCLICAADEKGNERAGWQHVLDHLFHGGVDAASLSIERAVEYRLHQAEERRRRREERPAPRHRLARLLGRRSR